MLLAQSVEWSLADHVVWFIIDTIQVFSEYIRKEGKEKQNKNRVDIEWVECFFLVLFAFKSSRQVDSKTAENE